MLVSEMNKFIDRFNTESSTDPVIKAAIAHLWFATNPPFDDGNGRITSAITDMQLSRADQSVQHFSSMSSQIGNERRGYYEILEKTQKGALDITAWLAWFLNCLDRALANTDETHGVVMRKARFWEKPSMTSLNDRQKIIIKQTIGWI